MKIPIVQLLLCVVAPLSWLNMSCNASGGDSGEIKEGQDFSLKNTASATSVQIALAANRTFNYVVNTNGKIKSLHEQVITAESGGKLVICKAAVGATFSKGALLAQTETTPIELRMERAQLNLYNATKEYESQLLGYQNLFTGTDTLQAAGIRKKLRISSRLSDAEQDIRELKYELSRSYIYASFDCRVSDVKVQEGGYLRPGLDMFRVYDAGNLVLEVKVLESDVAMLSKNIPAVIIPVASPESKYTAVLYDINPYIDENGMALVRLKVNGQPPLYPGMNCQAMISIPTRQSIVVPKEAVVMRSGKAVVFTCENDVARWHYVTVGGDNGAEVQIISGLKGGEKVIISNNLQLANDAPVKSENISKDSSRVNQPEL